MGYLYTRGTKIWMGYRDAQGNSRQRSTGLPVGQEAAAAEQLRQIEAGIANGAPEPAAAPTTVRQYERRWTAERQAQGVWSAEDEGGRLRLHALPVLGHLALGDVRPRHVRDLLRSLRANTTLAPRTLRHVYRGLHTMFRDAVVDELVPSNPCVLKRHDLPKAADKDATWRAGAVFSRDELEQLLSDERVPEDRRVLNALLALAGLRFGEASALRWRNYDTTLEPLGRILIASSWSTARRIEKATKAEQPRLVPVHPVLARVLATWKAGGWQRMMGRTPGPDDLIIPSRLGRNRSRHHALDKFHEDLGRLGLRPRRQHDLRRTFITLARIDGARSDVLETVTHGGRGDSVLDLYTTFPWTIVCEEVAKLKLRLAAPRPLQLAAAACADTDDEVAAAA